MHHRKICLPSLRALAHSESSTLAETVLNSSGYSSNKIRKTQNEQLNIICQNLNSQYSIVPNRCVGQNKRAGGKFLKNIKLADQNKAVQGELFLKINKHAGQIHSV